MFKKLLIAALAVVVGVGVVSGTRLGSHLRLKWNKAQAWAKEQVPLETDIERLKMEVANLKLEDERYYDQVARQEREVVKLQEKVNKSRQALASQETYIKEMRLALAEGGQFVTHKNERYDRKWVESDVRNEALRFLADEKVVKADEENLNLRKETLAMNKAKLGGLAVQRKEMEAQLLILERELAQQRLREQSSVVVDDGRYGKVNKEIEELRERFALLKTKADLRGEAQKGSIRAQEERKAEAQKLDQAIEERFGKLDNGKKLAD
jgi:chromosome segregation ATPase